MKGHEDTVRRELERHPGIAYRFDRSHKHDRVVLEYRGRSRFVVLGSTVSDCRALANMRRDIRREVRTLQDGAR